MVLSDVGLIIPVRPDTIGVRQARRENRPKVNRWVRAVQEAECGKAEAPRSDHKVSDA